MRQGMDFWQVILGDCFRGEEIDRTSRAIAGHKLPAKRMEDRIRDQRRLLGLMTRWTPEEKDEGPFGA